MFNELFKAGDQTVRRNILANIADGSLFAFAMSFVSIQTILPVFVQSMGGSNVAVGLVPVVWVFGFNFPQVFIVRRVQELEWKKPLFMRTALIQRIPWLLLALVCFFALEHLPTGVRLFTFFGFFLLAAVGGSLNLPVWFDLTAKLMPVRIRGRMFAARSIIGSMLGIGGGALTALVLATLQFPGSYGMLFLLAFLSMMASYWFLGMLREETPGPRLAEQRHYLETARNILITPSNFRNFLLSDALLIGSSMSNAFFAVYALKKFALSDAYAGAFTVVLMSSMIIASVLFGYLADQFGHKMNLLISAGATIAGSLTAILAASLEVFLIVFICSASGIAVNVISRLPMIAELCPEEQRPAYIALTNMLTSPFVLLGIVAGWMADRIGYESVFLLASVFALGALSLLAFKVREPRELVAATQTVP
ncbi:MAG: MFS transporter [Ignavibacteriales bacterium]|nr:MFS transporter [Ignavibacteriales bacterium]